MVNGFLNEGIMMDKIWYKSYDENISREVDLDTYESLIDLLEISFKKYSLQDSFYCMDKSYTYEELEILSRKFATLLQNKFKLKKGSRVALMLPNILQYPICLFGIVRAGMVPVNINPLYTGPEMEHVLKDSGAEVIIIFENACSLLAKVLKRVPINHILVTGIGDFLNFPKSLVVEYCYSQD